MFAGNVVDGKIADHRVDVGFERGAPLRRVLRRPTFLLHLHVLDRDLAELLHLLLRLGRFPRRLTLGALGALLLNRVEAHRAIAARLVTQRLRLDGFFEVLMRGGGRGEIRTHERVAPLAVFKTAALNHSATRPQLWDQTLSGYRGPNILATRSALDPSWTQGTSLVAATVRGSAENEHGLSGYWPV